MPDFADQRQAMVRDQLLPRGIGDERLLDAMATIPREAFVPSRYQPYAYSDGALSIGSGQTISQPTMVAEMIQAAAIQPGDTVLEVGAGSGYAAAILAKLAKHVYAIERLPAFVKKANKRLRHLNLTNIDLRAGDGSVGLPSAAPFNAIIVSAGGPAVPDALLQQLAPGGRLVMPTGNTPHEQQLVAVQRQDNDQYHWQHLGPVSFVPLVGDAGWDEKQ